MNSNLLKQEFNLPLIDGRKVCNENVRGYQTSPEVLTALRHGNHDAYVEIYTHYQKPICNFIHALIGSHETAEDITHDVFISVWENRKKIKPEQGIHRYLFTIAKHLAMRYFRQKKNENNYYEYNGQQSMEYTSPDELLIAKEADALVDMAISRMPRIRKQIFEMYYKENLSYRQIADKLRVNKATVANHLTNAKYNLRKIL